MKSNFINERIRFVVLPESISSFNDVDIAIGHIKLKYDVNIKEKIEGLDTNWIVAVVNKQYEICIRYHDLIGLTICAENEQSNEIITEIANYLSKEVFNEREDMVYTL